MEDSNSLLQNLLPTHQEMQDWAENFRSVTSQEDFAQKLLGPSSIYIYAPEPARVKQPFPRRVLMTPSHDEDR